MWRRRDEQAVGGPEFFLGRTDAGKRKRMQRRAPAFVLPHPSPLNVKWFLDHPEFERVRVKEIESAVHQVLGLS